MFDEIEKQSNASEVAKEDEKSILRITITISIVGFVLIVLALFTYSIIYHKDSDTSSKEIVQTSSSTTVRKEVEEVKENNTAVANSTVYSNFEVSELSNVSEEKEGTFIIQNIVGELNSETGQLKYTLKGKIKETESLCDIEVSYGIALKVSTGSEFLVTYKEVNIKSKLFILDLEAK